jgi:hypothetical protein
MNHILDRTARDISMGSAESLTFMTWEKDQPIVALLAAGFLMAAVLLAPALIGVVWMGCRDFCRRYGARTQPGRQSSIERGVATGVSGRRPGLLCDGPVVRSEPRGCNGAGGSADSNVKSPRGGGGGD